MPATKGKSKSSKKKTLIIIACVAAIALLVGAIAAKLFFDHKEAEEKEARIASIAQNAGHIVQTVKTALASSAPTTWVYDSEENLLMTIKLSSAVQAVSTVPTVLYNEIITNADGDPFSLVVNDYFHTAGYTAVGEEYEGFLRRLKADVSVQDIVRYLAIISLYGGTYRGLEDAANNYFGEPASSLNDAQVTFIAYTYRNDVATQEAYLASTGLTAERLGFFIQGNTTAVLRSIIMEQLQAVPGVDLNNNSYSVKTTVSSQHQSAYQSILDSSMRQLIDLNADGSYALNCSVAVVDKMTGFVRAYVPSRSSNTGSQSYFRLNSMAFSGNWNSLMEQFAMPYTYGFSLREITKANGDKELKTVAELFEAQELSTNVGDGYLTPLTLANLVYSGNSMYHGISFIYQVVDGSGKSVFLSEGVSVLTFDNPMVPEYFTEDALTRTMYGGTRDLTTGVLSFRSTKSYDIFIVAGSGAIGGSVSTPNRKVLQDTVVALQDAVARLYPTPDATIWDATNLVANKPKAYDANFLLVQPKVASMLAELKKIEINSSSARKQFESQYDEINQYISKYRECIGDGYADRLKSALSDVRLEKALLLAKYSV